MIYDSIQNLSVYRTVLPGIAVVEAFLARTDIAALAPGRIDLTDGIWVNVNRYTPAEAGKWEAHRSYIDLQYMYSGSETMRTAQLADCTAPGAYDAAADLQFFGGAARAVSLPTDTGDFAIFFPGDVHMPGVRCEKTASEVLKLVFKLPVPSAD